MFDLHGYLAFSTAHINYALFTNSITPYAFIVGCSDKTKFIPKTKKYGFIMKMNTQEGWYENDSCDAFDVKYGTTNEVDTSFLDIAPTKRSSTTLLTSLSGQSFSNVFSSLKLSSLDETPTFGVALPSIRILP